MNEKIYKIESGSYTFSFQIENEYAVITGYEGVGSRMLVPDKVVVGEQSYPVEVIGKKALLANKGLREVSLPGTIRKFDDWAMAQCEYMQTVIIREKTISDADIISNEQIECNDNTNETSAKYKEIQFGKGVFDYCLKIQDICLGYEKSDDQSALLGAVIHRMPAEYLLKDKDLGRLEWYQKWDQCLSTFLNEPDEDGYTDMVLCGEEDIFYQEPDFAMNKRKKKCALCMLRLMHKTSIGESVHKKFMDYLLTHVKGCKSEEAWEVTLDEFGENVAYYELLCEIGGVTKDNIDAMLSDMGERFAEAKAFLLNYKQTKFGNDDAFSIFNL